MPSDRIAAATGAPFPAWIRLALGAAALMASVPFLLPVHRFPIQSFYQEWLAFALGSAAFVAFCVGAHQRRIEAPRVVVLPLGLCLLVAIQVAAGELPYWQQGVLGGLYLLWAAAIAALGYGLRRCLGWAAFATLLSRVLVAGALATGLLAAAQLAGWGGEAWLMPLATTRVYGNLGQPNHFADYLSLGLMSVAYLVAAGRLARVPAAVIALFFLSILNFSASRAVWIYLIAALALSLFLHIRARDAQSRTLLVWMAAAVVVMILMQLIVFIGLPDRVGISETVASRLFQENTGADTRLRHGEATWLMLQGAPLLGVGFEAYGWHHFLLSAQLPPRHDLGVADHAHNIVLQVAAEFGLLGLAVGFAAGWLWLSAQRAASLSLERWWVYALLATMLAHSLLEYPLWYAYFLGTFALLLGASDERSWRFRTLLLERIALAGASVLAVWTLGVVVFDYRRLEGLARPGPATAGQVEQFRDTALALHRTSLFAHLVEFGLARTIRLEPEGLADNIALNGRAMRYLPTADVIFRQSALLALSGKLDEAFRIWDLGAAAYPAEAVVVARRLEDIAREHQPALNALVEYAASRR